MAEVHPDESKQQPRRPSHIRWGIEREQRGKFQIVICAHAACYRFSQQYNSNNFVFFFFGIRMHWADSNLSLPFACFSAFINRRLSKRLSEWKDDVEARFSIRHQQVVAGTSQGRKYMCIYRHPRRNTDAGFGCHARRKLSHRKRALAFLPARFMPSKDYTISFTKMRDNRLCAYECDCYFNIKCLFWAASVHILVGLLLHQQHQHYHHHFRIRFLCTMLCGNAHVWFCKIPHKRNGNTNIKLSKTHANPRETFEWHHSLCTGFSKCHDDVGGLFSHVSIPIRVKLCLRIFRDTFTLPSIYILLSPTD